MAQPEEIGRRFPRLTPAVAAAVVAVWFSPGLAEMLVYDRQAVLGGQVWRLATAPLVHFSLSHAGWNLLAFVAAGWLTEANGYRFPGLLCGATAVCSGLAFLLLMPEMARCGGLSGVATGMVVYFCLCRAAAQRANRFLWLGIPVVVAIKIAAELVAGHSLFVRAAAEPFRVVPLAHVAGFVMALLVWWSAGRPSRLAASRTTGKRSVAVPGT